MFKLIANGITRLREACRIAFYAADYERPPERQTAELYLENLLKPGLEAAAKEFDCKIEWNKPSFQLMNSGEIGHMAIDRIAPDTARLNFNIQSAATLDFKFERNEGPSHQGRITINNTIRSFKIRFESDEDRAIEITDSGPLDLLFRTPKGWAEHSRCLKQALRFLMMDDASATLVRNALESDKLLRNTPG